MRGLEVPREVVESLGQGKRPPVTITINGHSWKSRVAIMRGRYLLGLSNANRQAAGVVTGDEVEVELEFDPEPRVVVEPIDLARTLSADPIARAALTACPTGANASTCAPSRAQGKPRRAHGGSRRHWPRCGTRGRKGAPRPEGGLELRHRLPASPEPDHPLRCTESRARRSARAAPRGPCAYPLGPGPGRLPERRGARTPSDGGRNPRFVAGRTV
jgi:Domain of unknown function (DUF1905)